MKRVYFQGVRFILILLYSCCTTKIFGVDYYVSLDGDDTNTGALQAPFRTVQKALDEVEAGDVINIRRGIYREEVYFKNTGEQGKPITIQSYNGEAVCLRGSDLVSGWVLHDAAKNIWRKDNWQINSQQVFVHNQSEIQPDDDGVPLRQVGPINPYFDQNRYVSNFKNKTIYDDVAPGSTPSGVPYGGTFSYSVEEEVLYIRLKDGLNPNSLLVEVSTRARLLLYRQVDSRTLPHGHFYCVSGIRFSHSNSTYKTTGSGNNPVWFGKNTYIVGCEFAWLDFCGCTIGDNSFSEYCLFRNNGATGASGGKNFEFNRCWFLKNNEREFNPFWNSGGIKIVGQNWGRITNCEVAYNYGPGIWFDFNNSENSSIIDSNYVHHNNKESGIFIEISYGVIVSNNIVESNTRRGIYLSSSHNTRVVNNTVIGTVSDGTGRGAIDLESTVSRGGLTNNLIYNNLVVNNEVAFDVRISENEGSLGNYFNYNAYYRESGGLKFIHGSKVFGSLGAWVEGTGWDRYGLNVDPSFKEDAYPYVIGDDSELVDKGKWLGDYVVNDHRGVRRPQGLDFDIGAAESGRGEVLYLNFDEGQGGRAYDTSPQRNHSMELQDMSGFPSWVAGRVGNGALRFDGSTSSVTVGHSPSLSISGSMTVMGWFKPEETGADSSVIEKSGAYGLGLMRSNKGAVRWEFYVVDERGKQHRARSGYGYSEDGWQHVAGVYDGEKVAILLNGVEIASSSWSGSVKQTSANVEVGRSASGAYYRGDADEIRIYSRPVVGAELLEVVQEREVALMLTCDEGEGVRVFDRGRYGNHSVEADLGGEFPVWSQGRKGRSGLLFNGESSLVIFSQDESLNASRGLTVMGWFKPDLPSGEAGVLRKGGNYSLGVFSPGSGGVEWELRLTSSTGAELVVRTDYKYPNNQWVHVAAVFDGSQAKIYLNGVEAAVRDWPGQFSQGDEVLEIGRGNLAGFYSGEMDEISILTKALTVDEIGLYRTRNGE